MDSNNRRQGDAGARVSIGYDDYEGRQLPGGETAVARVRLETPRRIFPELDDAQRVSRPWFRHPAFLVSVVSTALALIAMGVLLIFDPFGGDEVDAVVDLNVVADDGSVTLSWSGAVDGALLYAIDPGDEAPLDVSQLVQGRSAWIPVSAGVYTPRTCFVVLPLVEDAPESVPVTAVDAQAVGGAMICVSDA